MSPWSALLRVVLILVLVLNGAGAAAASVTMMRATMSEGAPMATSAALETSSVQGETPPCHDMAQTTAKTASPDVAMQSPAHASHGKGKPTTPDCCKGGTCQCACMQAAHAALPAMIAFALVSPHSDVAHPMPAGHADPALPHLVRPPIG
ncbi:CopL family metal-binding regulatory protein [Pseudoxanthomonas helianthi]|uniref:CopL family metal-binding regulatory protein n=1 Tax=Pseudoxanthomonas helianthi TaxID=1453541 RepID=A0A940X3R1_9GAMM|nr:CopL family metal-binding regulatory protein [Pseudoxanthomonas helianthi]MBP3985359.1 CopL family metal-binding regulatory protein [Pseudoxanthomonas helianthi]